MKQLLEENTGENQGDHGFDDVFIYITKSMIHKRKFGRLDFNKID